jgi:hypothetical protein
VKLLFEEIAGKPFITQERAEKLRDWIQNADKVRASQDSSDKRANQYDKAEELITFYSFAPLALRKDKKEVIQNVLRLANIKEDVDGEIELGLEKQFPPPKGYLEWLQKEVSNHPVKYVREQGRNHIKRNRPLETHTHVDALIKSDNLVIFVEMKFTSDISVQTTFNPNRNQLSRLVDVGISAIEETGRKLIVLLCSPQEFFLKKSRLYYYKIREYSDLHEIEKDIAWRKQEEIEKYVSTVAWISLEKLIDIIYGNFNHHDKKEALDFFRERNMIS